jgi:hypothetical protein
VLIKENPVEDNWTYYAGVLPLRPRPSTVFRFPQNGNKWPQRFSKEHGWVEDRDVLLMKMKGDITDAAKISADEATIIIKELTRAK